MTCRKLFDIIQTMIICTSQAHCEDSVRHICHVWISQSAQYEINICFFLPLNTLSFLVRSHLFPFLLRDLDKWRHEQKAQKLTLSCSFTVEQEWTSPQPWNSQGPAGKRRVSGLLALLPSPAEWQWLEEYSAGIPSGQAQFCPYTTPLHHPTQ